jgi:hypothetical protein
MIKKLMIEIREFITWGVTVSRQGEYIVILYIYSTCWRMKSIFYERQQWPALALGESPMLEEPTSVAREAPVPVMSGADGTSHGAVSVEVDGASP